MRGNGLLRSGDAARADGPDWLVRQQNTGELLSGQTIEGAGELAAQHGFHLAAIAFSQRLSHAHNRRESRSQRGAQLAVYLIVRLAEDVPPFGVADKSVATTH